VTESAKSKKDVPLEALIRDDAVPLESILCSEELRRRPCRPPDYGKENAALVALVSALADSPRTILQTLAEKVLDVLQADSAGLSLLTKDEKRFYWAAIAGAWQPHTGGGTPRDSGPCGDVLDRNAPMLFTHWERRYPYLRPAIPLAEEGLLVPFYVNGKAVGTIWAIAHNARRQFDAEDLRLLESLGRFASAAYQAVASIDDLKFQIAEREKAEAALQELARGLEAKLRRLVEANIIGIVIANLEGQIIEANEAFLRMVGYDREDLLSGRVSWSEVTPDKWREVDEQALAELKATGVCEPFEKEYNRKDGSRVPVLVGAALVEGSRNEGVAFVLDLSEQKRSEEALRRSEYYLAEAQRLSHTGSWAFSVATREIVHWSQEHFRIFGFDPEDGMPSFETLMQRIHPDDRATAAEVIEIGIRERTDYEQDFRIVLPNGTTRYIHAIGHPVFNSSGDPVEFMGTVIDVTESKRAAEARACQASVRADVSASLSTPVHLGEILQGAAEAIVRHLDAVFARIWTLNKEKNLLELQASAGVYTHLDGPHSRIEFGKLKIGLIAQEKRPHLTNDVLTDPRVSDKVWARNEGMVSFAGYPLIVQDRVVGVMAMFARQHLSTATLDALASIADSIAQGIERNRVEEALRKTKTDLAHVTRVASLGEMSASIAHEINQPLAAVINSASACLRWIDAQKLEEARRSASRAIAEGHRASEIIGRIRALAKKAPPQKDWLDVNETIHEVIALTRSEIQRNGVVLETELSEHVPVVLADRIQLQQVILNLMMNAIEAMSGVGNDPRELLVRSGTDESKQMVISVQDSGPGIDPEKLDNLFEAFYTTKPQGMGMGLAISRSILEAHGGRLWAKANTDKGATFQFTLPVGGGNQHA
jgi:PAS domain S-box-containing protein